MTAPTTKPPSCMDEAFGLSMKITAKLFDDFCAQLAYRFGGEDFDMEDNPGDEDGEIVLRRKSDGAQFEVELFAEVRAITDGGAAQ